MNDEDQEFGSERLADAIACAKEGCASAICQAVMEDLAAFNGTRLSDDRTLVVIKAV
jgi:serine phosphatase RsbU (regulator of sigma subunit)